MSLSDFATLAEAKAHPEIRGKMIHRNSMNAWLSDAGKYRRLKTIANDDDHPLADGAAAFLDSTEYNLIQSSATGQAVIALMQALISAEGDDADLQGVLDDAIAYANEIYHPYASATQYDFLKAKSACPVKEVSPVNGWLKITTTADCEAHRPQVYVDIQGVKRRVAGFDTVKSAGDYVCQVPVGHSIYYVDDAYGVVG